MRRLTGRRPGAVKMGAVLREQGFPQPSSLRSLAALAALATAALVLGLSGAASAASPSVVTFAVTSVTTVEAEVTGTVNPQNLDTAIGIQYDVASSTWCTSGGTAGSPANRFENGNLNETDGNPHAVSLDFDGLTAGTAYCAELIAGNSSGQAAGSQVTWTQGEPNATTTTAASSGATSATVEGTVNPAAQTTTYDVEYDLAGTTWCTSGGASGTPGNSTSPTGLGATDSNGHGVSVTLASLTAGASYCGRIVATSGSGPGEGVQLDWTQGAPVTSTDSVIQAGAATATVEGSIDPLGQATSFVVNYDTATSTWCSSSGASGSPGNSTTPQDLSTTAVGSHDVSIQITGLAQGVAYCAQLVATDSSGSEGGRQLSWTQGAPMVDTIHAFTTGQAAVEITGKIDSRGQSTTWVLEYDVAGSPWCQSDGYAGTPEDTPSIQLAATDDSFHRVTANLGVDLHGDYCAAIAASNDNGTNEGLPTVTWHQGAPVAKTLDARAAGSTTAYLDGLVNPGGSSPVYYWAQYDLSTSAWCQSGGFTGTPAHTTSESGENWVDSAFHDETVTLTGLTSGTSYCAQVLTGSNAGPGQLEGGQVRWTQGAPIVETADAYSTSTSATTVEGAVNPAGENADYVLEYDLAGSRWCQSGGYEGAPEWTTSARSLGATDNASHTVTASLGGLTAGTNYCSAFAATNSTGAAEGLPVVGWQQGAAVASSVTASATGPTVAIVQASMNPAGQSTTYEVQYDVASSGWCLNDGTKGSPAYTTPPQSLSATDGAFHDFTVDLSGLTYDAPYCAEVVSTNSSGAVDGGTVEWTQQPSQALIVGDIGNGPGSITSNDGLIDCPSGSCLAYYYTGAQVALTATPSAGASFTGWSGGTCAGTGTCVVTMTAPDVVVNATFSSNPSPPPPSPVWLTVLGQGTGAGLVTSSPSGISCPPETSQGCDASFSSGTRVTLTAAPNTGSMFAGWSGGGCTGTGTCTITLNSQAYVTATFDAVYSLKVTDDGGGSGTVTSSPAGINCSNSSCSHTYPSGTTVVLTEEPQTGSTFTGWTGACEAATAKTCTVAMNAQQLVLASFSRIPTSKKCDVPKVTGKTLAAATRTIKRSHCGVGKISRAHSSKVTKGRVLAQKPKPGLRLAHGARVKLVVSSGPPSARRTG